MATSKRAYNQALSHFKRSAGRYKRYGIDPEKYLQAETNTVKGVERALDKIKFDVEQQLIEERIRKREEEEARKYVEALREAKLALDNMRYMLKTAETQVKSSAARSDVERSANTLLSIIDEAERTWGPIFTVESAAPWVSGANSKLERLALAIYDEYYNTNDFWCIPDTSGDVGRSRYITDIYAFARDLKVAVPTIAYMN